MTDSAIPSIHPIALMLASSAVIWLSQPGAARASEEGSSALLGVLPLALSIVCLPHSGC